MKKENIKPYFERNKYQALYILLYTPEFAPVKMIFSNILRFEAIFEIMTSKKKFNKIYYVLASIKFEHLIRII